MVLSTVDEEFIYLSRLIPWEITPDFLPHGTVELGKMARGDGKGQFDSLTSSAALQPVWDMACYTTLACGVLQPTSSQETANVTRQHPRFKRRYSRPVLCMRCWRAREYIRSLCETSANDLGRAMLVVRDRCAISEQYYYGRISFP
jgi:hypothetical protein